jgi:hypothetical protein
VAHRVAALSMVRHRGRNRRGNGGSDRGHGGV